MIPIKKPNYISLVAPLNLSKFNLNQLDLGFSPGLTLKIGDYIDLLEDAEDLINNEIFTRLYKEKN